MSKVQACRECGQPLLWLENNNTGRVAPIDAEPVQFGGNIEVLADDNGEIAFYRVISKGQPGPQTRHRSHFATCPKAQEVRERVKARE